MAQGLTLGIHQLMQAWFGQIEQPIQLAAAESGAFSGALDLE